MANGKIDKNFIHTGIVCTDEVPQQVANLQVEPITGALLIDVLFVASLPTPPTMDKRDYNFYNVAIGVTDNVAQSVRPWLVDPTTNRLIVKFV